MDPLLEASLIAFLWAGIFVLLALGITIFGVAMGLVIAYLLQLGC